MRGFRDLTPVPGLDAHNICKPDLGKMLVLNAVPKLMLACKAPIAGGAAPAIPEGDGKGGNLTTPC